VNLPDADPCEVICQMGPARGRLPGVIDLAKAAESDRWRVGAVGEIDARLANLKALGLDLRRDGAAVGVFGSSVDVPTEGRSLLDSIFAALDAEDARVKQDRKNRAKMLSTTDFGSDAG
jgi:hypothetical protein